MTQEAEAPKGPQDTPLQYVVDLGVDPVQVLGESNPNALENYWDQVFIF